MPKLKAIKRFRVGPPDGPHRQPRTSMFGYFFPVEMEPHDPTANLEYEIKIVVTHLQRISLSGGPGTRDTDEGEGKAVQRLWYWVTRQVPGLVDRLVTEEGFEVRLSDPDFADLIDVLPEKVGYDPEKWFELQVKSVSFPRQIFISCGQATSDEIALGKAIEKLVSATPGIRGYFAQNQDSPSAVTEHILRALNDSVALICVMHRRGEVEGRDGKKTQRGSVWIEQEIAIVAFMEQILGRPLPVRLYCESGIATEGLRRQIMVHPVIFKGSEEILKDLREWIPTLGDIATSEKSAITTEEENRLIEEGIREYPILGSAKVFLDRYPGVPASLKRRMHKAIVNGHRARYGGRPKELTEEMLRTLYSDEG